MASKVGNSAGLRAVRSCTECKQAKVATAHSVLAPMRLTNQVPQSLHKMPVETAILSGRRDISAHACEKLEAMSRELEELRSQRDRHETGTRSESGVETSPFTDEGAVEKVPDDFDLSVEVVVLYDTFVEAHLALDAFKAFVELFMPQFPLISPIIVERMYKHQPFLFWTIVVIVCSHLPGSPYDTLFAKLHGPYRRLLSEEILDTPLPLHKIQALLFLCVWPLPVDTQPKDPSWLYIGIALQAARFMGLDRDQPMPSLRSVGVASGTTPARINTWVGCFYIGTSLALHLGLRPPIDSELDFSTIQTYLSRRTVPFEFATHVKVHLIVSKFTNLLGHDVEETVATSMMRLMDSELDRLGSAADDDADVNRIEFSILVVKLHFYAYLITRFRPESITREVFLKTGLSTAIRIISISTLPLPGSGQLKGDPRWIRKRRSLPKNYYRGLAFATIFLIKFFHLNSAMSKDEQQSAACHIGMAQDVFKTCSTEPRDEYGRAAKVFELLAQLTPDSADTTKLRLTHRMGVSIVLDAITTASEIRGQNTEIGENQSLDEAMALSSGNTLDAGQLPDATFISEQVNSSVDFLREFWDDPLMNMLNIEPIIPYHE
ncbi:hypothetical protein jhhlp_004966 [Lomentospora prolificans]|uniref:Xylanolytic transcriptional activator regulatory domain-containing protein n=1 Tax=Lomentospora prolificans TaxID=41688 RepID=A0A2N3N805_9PEZI|nr:hypothetical protein jhhlp_004966 [Lomentospora prolificans]